MFLWIIQRYVMGEVLRAFGLALLTMTSIFVLFMVMAEATKLGLSPRDVALLIPYVIPGTLPFTVPVSLLFAVTVVFGRLASDNEIIAVKTAGVSAMAILWPAILLSAILSSALLYLSYSTIPYYNHQAKLAIFKNFEEAFYKWLKMEREFNNPDWPFLIKVRDVDTETRTMYGAVFKHRNKKDPIPNTYDLVVTAEKAQINFDTDKGEARVYLEDSESWSGGPHEDIFLINEQLLVMPIPDKSSKTYDKKIQEWTTPEMLKEQEKYERLVARERKRQALSAALWIGSGRLNRVEWGQVQSAFTDHNYWTRKISEFETEKQFRIAQSFGSLMFVLLGAPVGILFARRDFLSAFISCFVPIILLYYPIMLLGVNLGKEGVLNPLFTLWGGNALLGVLAIFVFPPVIKH